ncbi:HK97 family phage prohead protease [Sphingomonas donggukensis]|uniref:HK97 family phage prohead protease n=1 Tax=Sphingomonas donggukensis TaxID=2949093 RepID=A0ABY4TVJ7_9SPHN|nr:prohead protease/major capsid protein fusion protein [Sphingomonas donggukensis]URW76418.1 HK97 family phage prohead protease [Sphingomonas donggukensis]
MSDLLTRRLPATISPASLQRHDDGTATVTATLSTGAPVRRAGFVESLAIGPDHVSFAANMPVLDAHRQTSIGDVKGRVEAVRFEGGAIVATLRISDPLALAAIERGDITGVSVGYRASAWKDGRDAANGQKTRTMTKWEVLEVSLVPVPADQNATIRSNTTMEPETISEPDEAVTTRAEIRTICRAAGMTPEQADELIDRGATVTEARASAWEASQARRPVIIVGRSSEDPAIVRGYQAEALAATYTGAEPSDGARQYMGLGMHDHMRLCLTRSGESGVQTMGADALVTRAMGTTSDFPITLDDAGTRIVLASYRAAESPLKSIGVQRNLPDFREATAIRTGGLPTLKKVTEAGEIKHVTIPESGEKFKLDTYASIFGLTRQVLINDRFGVLGDFARNAGNAAAATERELLLSVLLETAGAGPAMSDGKALFHADHGNLGIAAAPDVDELSAARLAMRVQTGLDGVTRISVAPKYLVVAADLETKGEQLLAALAAAKVDDANPFSGKLTLLVEPGLPEGAWYLFADPAQVPTLAYGYLSSAPGPQLASRDGWDVLGREWRVVLDFGAGAIDWRGAYRNPGEAL